MVKAVNYEEFRRHLGKAGLTNKAFAELVAINEKSVTNMAQKPEVPNHYAVIALLMGELADNGIEFKAKLLRLELKDAKPRGKGFEKTSHQVY